MAPVRFLRIMSENEDRTAERSWAVDKPEGSIEVVGDSVEGEGKAADEDGVEDGGAGVGGGEGGAADGVVAECGCGASVVLQSGGFVLSSN